MENIAKLTSYGCYLDCDFVTAKYPGNETHIVGNVAEYVYDLEQKISDLEAKLAKSEKSNEYFADRVEKADKEIKEIYKKYNKLVEEYNNLKEEVDNNFVDGQDYNQLKQQLAEKDEKIEKLKSENHALISDNAYQEADIFELNSFKKYYKNNKISFAVEQLEKVKEFLKTNWMDGIDIDEFIDNQIKELKQGK